MTTEPTSDPGGWPDRTDAGYRARHQRHRDEGGWVCSVCDVLEMLDQAESQMAALREALTALHPTKDHDPGNDWDHGAKCWTDGCYAVAALSAPVPRVEP